MEDEEETEKHVKYNKRRKQLRTGRAVVRRGIDNVMLRQIINKLCD